MSSDPFVHLHVASGYSLRYGTSLPHRLVERAADHGMDTLALTDRDGVYGAVRFVKACQGAGIRPVLGVDLAVRSIIAGTPPRIPAPRTPEPRPPVSPIPASPASPIPAPRIPVPRTPVRGGADVDPRHPRVRLLAPSKRGWAALCRLISATHMGGDRGTPVTTLDLIAEYAAAGNLVVLLGPDSDVGRAMASHRSDVARALLLQWQKSVGRGDLYLEVVSHRAAGAQPFSTVHAARMLGLAREVGVPAVLSNAVRYVDRSDAPVADVLDATRRLVALDLRHVDRINAEGYLKPGKEMGEIAEEISRAAGGGTSQVHRLLATTRTVADRCALDPRVDLGIGEVFLPELSVVVNTDSAPAAGRVTGPVTKPITGHTDAVARASTLLAARCESGLHRRYGATPSREIHDRLTEELTLIRDLGYPSYFLTIADVCDLIRARGVRVAARGSGAGSLVCYLLGISGVDPVRHGLLMERFLSPLRHALPDVDIDVESARRTEIYQAILDRFGTERVACVSMMDTYRVRHAIRDVGAALGLPPGEIDSIAKAFPHIRARDARAALVELPELRASRIDAPHLDVLFRLVERLDGLPRHIALHPCGVLLSDATLLDRTPVEKSFLGFPMSQFDKDDVEDLGLLKLDVLGIRMQSAMAHAVDEIRRVDGVDVDLDDPTCVALDDPATFRLIQSTRTLGCFQIESPGQRELVGKFGPETFDDIIIDISLFRPGPVKSDMVTPFLEARHGWQPAQYLHPDLAKVLDGTSGVVVFHEQVIEIIATFTGCTRAEADEARRALGDEEGKEEVRQWFPARALARGYDLPTVNRVWEVLEAFASFGFCKAHAAAFALPTYQSAWLKAHYPAAFLAGVLTHDPGMYPKRLILDDARNFGITVLGLDVNASGRTYHVERVGDGYGIRLALADVKGISDAEVTRIEAGQPYHSLTDFWHRAGVARPIVERLIIAGAFDALYRIGVAAPVRRRGAVTRRDLLLQAADLDRWHKAMGTQLTLDLGAAPAVPPGSGLPEMTGAERIRAELDVLGLDASQHVVTFYRDFLTALGVSWSRDLLTYRSQAELLVAGVKVATQTPPVRSGRRVIFLTLDDSTGPVDATFFEDAQGAYAATLFHSWLLVVRGVLRRTGSRGVSLRATGCWELTTLYETWRTGGLAAVAAVMTQSGEYSVPTMAAATALAESRSTRPVMVAPPKARQFGSGVSDASSDAWAGSKAGGMGRRRVLVHPSGFRQSPYADLKPPGTDVKSPPRKLWHASPGSPGR
jgi:error-prone DNA polymerase